MMLVGDMTVVAGTTVAVAGTVEEGDPQSTSQTDFALAVDATYRLTHR